jgi:hypothetical protein
VVLDPAQHEQKPVVAAAPTPAAAPVVVVPAQHEQKPLETTVHPPAAEPEPKATADQPEAASLPAEAPQEDPPGNKSLVGPSNRSLSEALSLGSDGRLVSLNRRGFLEFMDSTTALLDLVSGGSIGSYLQPNIKKMRNSKASASEDNYRAWMLSELPVHAAAGYKGYVDNSAWMANIWTWWTLEFFIELFAGIVESTSSMKVLAAEVHNRTLYNHQNFFQRTAFTTGMKQLPDRNGLLGKLHGEGTPDDVLRDLATLVSLGRPLITYLGEVNGAVENLLQAEKKAKGK